MEIDKFVIYMMPDHACLLKYQRWHSFCITWEQGHIQGTRGQRPPRFFWRIHFFLFFILFLNKVVILVNYWGPCHVAKPPPPLKVRYAPLLERLEIVNLTANYRLIQFSFTRTTSLLRIVERIFGRFCRMHVHGLRTRVFSVPPRLHTQRSDI